MIIDEESYLLPKAAEAEPISHHPELVDLPPLLHEQSPPPPYNYGTIQRPTQDGDKRGPCSPTRRMCKALIFMLVLWLLWAAYGISACVVVRQRQVRVTMISS
jgi:hypothetical protein